VVLPLEPYKKLIKINIDKKKFGLCLYLFTIVIHTSFLNIHTIIKVKSKRKEKGAVQND
jgi:hypothetical protein